LNPSFISPKIYPKASVDNRNIAGRLFGENEWKCIDQELFVKSATKALDLDRQQNSRSVFGELGFVEKTFVAEQKGTRRKTARNVHRAR